MVQKRRDHASRARQPRGPVSALGRLLAAAGLLALLGGCTLSSGQQTTTGKGPGGGSFAVEFVTSDSMEGASEETIQIADHEVLVSVICTASIKKGGLQIEILKPDGSAALTLKGQTTRENVATALVRTDAEGRLRYRISTSEAHGGAYRIVYQIEG
jgi:hypothetical protein